MSQVREIFCGKCGIGRSEDRAGKLTSYHPRHNSKLLALARRPLRLISTAPSPEANFPTLSQKPREGWGNRVIVSRRKDGLAPRYECFDIHPEVNLLSSWF